MVVLARVAVVVTAVSVVVVDSAFGELVASSASFVAAVSFVAAASFVAVASFVTVAFVAPKTEEEEEEAHSDLCLPLLRQIPGSVSTQNLSYYLSYCRSQTTSSWVYVCSSPALRLLTP